MALHQSMQVSMGVADYGLKLNLNISTDMAMMHIQISGPNTHVKVQTGC